MVRITLPDQSVREYEGPVSGMDIARTISGRLAREVLSVSVDGETWDLERPIEHDASVQLYTWEDREGKETFWHTSAHLMAQAIEEFYPGTRFGIGPTVETGFYYDIDLPDGMQLSEKDLEKIEKRMLELSREKQPVTRKSISKAEALSFSVR